MRKGLLLVLVLGIGGLILAATVQAGPNCGKAAADKAAATSTCSKSKGVSIAASNFPAMVVMVGDETFHCPVTAKKVAEERGEKMVCIIGEKHDNMESAMAAYAEAAESYADKYLRVACVVDGKLKYCDDDASACCGKSATVVSTESCCKSVKAAVASAASTCNKSQVKSVSADDTRTCSKSKVVKASSSTCTKTKVAAADDSKATCSKSKEAKLAKADGPTCSKSKEAKLAKADGPTCSKSKEAKLAKADDSSVKDKSGCCKGDDIKFMMAGRLFDTREEAEAARAKVLLAVKLVSMQYRFGDKTVDCATKVCPKAKEAGLVKFVVGDTTYDCEYHARINLAKAKVAAAEKAMQAQTASL